MNICACMLPPTQKINLLHLNYDIELLSNYITLPKLFEEITFKISKNSSSLADIIPLITTLKYLILLSDEDTQEIREIKDVILIKRIWRTFWLYGKLFVYYSNVSRSEAVAYPEIFFRGARQKSFLIYIEPINISPFFPFLSE